MIEKLREIFITETEENLNDLEKEITHTPFQNISKDIAGKMFSTAHNIKGTAPMVGIHHLTEIVIPLEKVFNALKDNQLTLSEDIIENTIKVIPIIKAGLNVCNENYEHQSETKKIVDFFESLIK